VVTRVEQEKKIAPKVKQDPSQYAQAIVGQQVSTPTLAPGTSLKERLVLQQPTAGTLQEGVSVAKGTAVSPTGVTAQAPVVSPEGTVIQPTAVTGAVQATSAQEKVASQYTASQTKDAICRRFTISTRSSYTY
jgi:hypothetical protein